MEFIYLFIYLFAEYQGLILGPKHDRNALYLFFMFLFYILKRDLTKWCGLS